MAQAVKFFKNTGINKKNSADVNEIHTSCAERT
jgi:hypothetical protein